MSSFLARDSVHRDEIKMIHTHKHSAAYRELPPTQINEMSFSHSWVLIWMREVKSLPLAVTSFLSSRWHQPCSRLSLALAWRKWHLSLGRNLPQAKTLRHPQADLQDLTQREPWWFGLEELGMRTGQITHLGWDLPDPSHSPLPLWAVLMQKKPSQLHTGGWGNTSPCMFHPVVLVLPLGNMLLNRSILHESGRQFSRACWISLLFTDPNVSHYV